MDRLRLGLDEEELTYSINGAFFEVYHTFGSGFLERVYVAALMEELALRGHRAVRELDVRICYKGKDIAWQRIDLVVDNKVIIECKAALALPAIAARQLQNYLQATRFEIGLLLHFGPLPKAYRLYYANSRKKFQQ
jgi:GxxExxY protein